MCRDRTDGGEGGRNAQALRIVTRSNMLLTQSVDEDETESAGISLDDGVSAYRQQFIGGSVFIARAASAGYSSSQKKKKNRHSCERRCGQPIETPTSARSSGGFSTSDRLR